MTCARRKLTVAVQPHKEVAWSLRVVVRRRGGGVFRGVTTAPLVGNGGGSRAPIPLTIDRNNERGEILG